jgi:hypothetical protein|tara:strand:- start:1227 stop:1412 length:186 start_codon:yes stop_codon:yes gene_type:complete
MNINLEKAGDYAAKRKEYYQDFGDQLDELYHDINSGKLGEDAKTSDFFLGRKAVKDKYPKP